MSVAKNPQIEGRVTLNKLRLLMLDNGIDVIYHKTFGIPASNIKGDEAFVNVNRLVPKQLERWRRSYVATEVLGWKLLYGCSIYWDSAWGIWRIRAKPKPEPKKRGPKPRIKEE